ncbi:tautomerase family protein [uncultured Kocuria sp.]|uniref:tautomerase family protein n=1 Tax=uncultured Kocuria sp. TaxID=259305 RepID=UPI002592D953|nr:tautomerase family protein [uncultured Kocuria sp.]MCT1368017.1 tautomerase family protein [Rothia sp. p3-SID1597]
MPLIRIDAMKADVNKLTAISEAIRQALHETIGFPLNDLFHIVQSHDGDSGFLRWGDYLDVQRDEGIVYVQVFLRAGRPASAKQAFYAKAAELVHREAGVEPRNLFIVLSENQSEDWSLGNGAAQYL